MSHVNEQRLALSRILIVTALREPTWVVVLQRWIKARHQHLAMVPRRGTN